MSIRMMVRRVASSFCGVIAALFLVMGSLAKEADSQTCGEDGAAQTTMSGTTADQGAGRLSSTDGEKQKSATMSDKKADTAPRASGEKGSTTDINIGVGELQEC